MEVDSLQSLEMSQNQELKNFLGFDFSTQQVRLQHFDTIFSFSENLENSSTLWYCLLYYAYVYFNLDIKLSFCFSFQHCIFISKLPQQGLTQGGKWGKNIFRSFLSTDWGCQFSKRSLKSSFSQCINLFENKYLDLFCHQSGKKC